MSENVTVNPSIDIPQRGIQNLNLSKIERARRHAVNVLFLIYLIIILDGVVRKYLLPGLEQPLVFLRDPVILYLYIHALRYGLIKRSLFLGALGALIVLICLIVVPQSLGSSGAGLLLLFYGLRQLLFPFLLPFIIGNVFSYRDLRRFFRINMVLITLMAPLMVIQVLSPLGSWINTGVAYQGLASFDNLTYGAFVRAPGFFTSAQPLVMFLPLIGAILLSIWIMPRHERPCSSSFLAITAFAFMVAIAVSGNRGAIVSLVIVAISGVIGSFLMLGNRASGRVIGASIFLTIAALIISVTVFPEQFQALDERWSGANEGAGYFAIITRALNSLTEFIDVIPNTPFGGFGLGAATNAAVILSADPWATSSALLSSGENDWSRHLIEMGTFVGILYIAFRISFTIYLGSIGLTYLMRYANLIPWLIFAAVGYTIFNGTMSGQTTINGLWWFTAGLILAAPNYVQPDQWRRMK